MKILAVAPFGNIHANYLVGGYANTGAGQALGNFIRNIITATFLVSGLVALALLIMGGLKYLTAGGDSKAIESATKTLTSAVVGLAIVLGSYGLAKILEGVFGIDIFRPTFVGP